MGVGGWVGGGVLDEIKAISAPSLGLGLGLGWAWQYVLFVHVSQKQFRGLGVYPWTDFADVGGKGLVVHNWKKTADNT